MILTPFERNSIKLSLAKIQEHSLLISSMGASISVLASAISAIGTLPTLYISSSLPTASDGIDGDYWSVYV